MITSSQILTKIAGEYPEFSLEHRALNILNFSTALNFATGSIFGLIFQMDLKFFLIQFFVSVIIFLFFFLTRIKKKKGGMTIVSAIGILILFLVGSISEGGLSGPAFGVGTGYFILFVSLSEEKKVLTTNSLLYVLIFLLGLAVDYFYPEVIVSYKNEEQRHLDFVVNFFQTIIPVYLLFLSNRECYRYEQEQVLQKNNQLAVANTTKEKLFAIIGHDLRSPITSLDSLFLMLKDKRISKDELPHQLQQIQNKTGQIRELLDNLLYWAVSQMEHMQTDAMLLSPYQLAEVELSMLRELAAYKHLTLVNNLLPAATIFADSEQSKIILRNLLTNAVKYASEGGDVVISSEERNNMQIITVTNTGKWLEEQAPHPTFDPKRKGFGLFLSKEFATKNGGSLTVNATDSDIVIVTWTVPKNSGAVLRR